jgi:hypothetical protein
MKIIEVNDETYSKLIELANEMINQDNRGTRMPHIFQIRDWKKVYDSDLNGDKHIFIDTNNDYNEIESIDEFKEYLSNNDINIPDNINEIWDDYLELDDFVDEYCPDLKKTSYSLEPFYVNSFFTAKSAQKHLDLNYYHYHKDADVYLNHAWRNSEMELVSGFLCSLVGKDIYK